MQMFSQSVHPSILWLSVVTFVKGGEHLNPFDLHTWTVLLSNMFSFNKAIYHQFLFISALCPPAEAKAKLEYIFFFHQMSKSTSSLHLHFVSAVLWIFKTPKIKHLVSCTFSWLQGRCPFLTAWCSAWECSSARTRLHSAPHYSMLACCVQLISY